MNSNKSTKALLVGVLLLSTATFAKVKPADSRFVEQIQTALKSDNPGVVESSIYVSLMAKNMFPEFNYNKVLNELSDLAADGNSAVIKYKAQLAAIYFKYPALFTDIEFKPTETPDKYFKMISNKLVDNSLVSN